MYLSESEKASKRHTELVLRLLREDPRRKELVEKLGPIVGMRTGPDGVSIQSSKDGTYYRISDGEGKIDRERLKEYFESEMA